METAAILCLAVTLLYAVLVAVFSVPLCVPGKVSEKSVEDYPFVSVIIPARNEASNLPVCLASVLQQDYPRERFEVLVSDDHSEDGTAGAVREFGHDHPDLRVHLVSPEAEAAGGKKAALDRAIGQAVGELILVTDADTDRGPRWISSLVAEQRAGNREMVLGPVELSGGTGLFARIQSLEFLGIMGITAGSARLGRPVMCNGANLLYSKKAYGETGGMASHARYTSGDDQFLMAGIRKRYGTGSVSFALDRDAVVRTAPQVSLRQFFHQRIRWVSKSAGYRDPVMIATGLLVYVIHLVILFSLMASAFFPFLWWHALACWGIKMAVDLLPVVRMAGFFRHRSLLWLYVPGQAFQLFYVVLSGLLGLFLPYRWKGRWIRA